MAYPTRNWLLEPIIPAPPALPRLDYETQALAGMEQSTNQYPSGTWLLGSRSKDSSELEDEEVDSQRFATSDSEAPTVRPGALSALKAR